MVTQITSWSLFCLANCLNNHLPNLHHQICPQSPRSIMTSRKYSVNIRHFHSTGPMIAPSTSQPDNLSKPEREAMDKYIRESHHLPILFPGRCRLFLHH